jgi:carboxymethylenebutenolidase
VAGPEETTSAPQPETVVLRAAGHDVPTLLYRPPGRATSGVVLGAEAQGVNAFIRDVAQRLCRRGHLVAVPDYYHGEGPEDPEVLVDLAHLAEIQAVIDQLDFRQGAEDQLAAVELLCDEVPRVAVWGYCTGGTLSMLAACLDRRVDAAVLFYPSQPRFHDLGAARPQDPVDLIWQLRRPVLLIVGDEDAVWPPELRQEVAERFARWSIPFELAVYPGAGHAFAGHFEDWHRPHAAAASWERAVAFLDEVLGLEPAHEGPRIGREG